MCKVIITDMYCNYMCTCVHVYDVTSNLKGTSN